MPHYKCQEAFNRFRNPHDIGRQICRYFELALLAGGEVGEFEEIDGWSCGEMDV